MRELAEAIELSATLPDLNVPPEEYLRLLGYPQGWVLEGRALELASWAREWYARNGRPWLYARQAESFEVTWDSIRIDGVAFNSERLKNMLQQDKAHSVILAAVGAGPEAEEEARRRWDDEKPDEYFFLEVFASAVVEHLATAIGARLCDWAEQHGMAMLPHYSPGYPEWDVAEQSRLLELMKRTRNEPFPAKIEAFDSGMLRPKKTLLAVFGVTQYSDQLRRLTVLVPCENCSFGSCQYRRAPYRRASQSWAERLPVRVAVLDHDAEYSVSRKALKRWADERLSMNTSEDGTIDARFRFEGTTCTNMGQPLVFSYRVKLGPRAEGYPIWEQSCDPAEGETGYTAMCQYIEDPARLMAAIDCEKPLSGERLNAVLSWRRKPSGAGCYCESSSRDHKWGLVLETIHFALAQQEMKEDAELL